MSTATTVELDRSEVVAQVRAAFDRYERALAAGDVAVLTELFWDDARCVRFGVADRQQGADEIAAWRAAHPTVSPGRRLSETRVMALDERTAVVTTLFGYPDQAMEGRQSQTWARVAAGWRIVAAHVSEVPTPELQQGDTPPVLLEECHPAAVRGAPATTDLAIVAAHRRGQPLHAELLALGARFAGVAFTAPRYRLVALPGTGVPRGGIVVTAQEGVSVEVELHELPVAALGELLCALPAPLALGRVELRGGDALGMVCACAPPGSVDISAHGSWPSYLAARSGDPLAAVPTRGEVVTG